MARKDDEPRAIDYWRARKMLNKSPPVVAEGIVEDYMSRHGLGEPGDFIEAFAELAMRRRQGSATVGEHYPVPKHGVLGNPLYF